MNRKGVKVVLFLVLAVVFVSYSHVAFSAETTGKILGTVVGTKDAAVKTSLGSWAPIAGKTYPLIDGTSLQARTGMLSVLTRDSVKIDAGKSSVLSVSGASGQYSISLQEGGVVLRIPENSGVTVTTRTASINVQPMKGTIQKVSLNSERDRVGVVTFDGKGTRISAFNGSFLVVNSSGTAQELLSKGSAVYVTGAEGGYAIRKVQTADEDTEDARKAGALPPAAGAAGAAGAGGAAATTGGISGTTLAVAGGLVAAAGVTAAATSGGSSSGPSASPTAP